MASSADFIRASNSIAVKGSFRYYKGSHKKVTKSGGGDDFQYLSEYTYGEAFRDVHAGVSARTGKYHVKRYYDDIGKESLVILDPTYSMFFGNNRSKWCTALNIVEVILLSLAKDGGKVRLVVPGYYDTGRINREGIAQAIYLLEHFTGNDLSKLNSFLSTKSNDEMFSSIVFITDMFSISESLISFVRRCAARDNLTIIRVVDPLEIDLPIAKSRLVFKDPESGEVVKTAVSREIKDEYRRLQLEHLNVTYLLLTKLNAEVVDIYNNERYLYDLVRMLNHRREYAKFKY